jgi:ligand-binding sensor domain-containing protein
MAFQNPLILNENSGLPSNNILSIQEDKQGFVWIATDRGLCRYDGINIEVFDRIPNDTSQVFTREVEDILVDDRTGHLWLATRRGLHVYNPYSGRFRSYLPDPGNPASIPQLNVRSLYQDRQQRIWIGLSGKGIARYIPARDAFENWVPSDHLTIPASVDPESVNGILDLSQDRRQDHIYWLASNAGLIRWDRKSGEATLHILRDERRKEGNLNNPLCLFQAANGKVFQGLWSIGFSIYNPHNGQFRLIDRATAGGKEINFRTVYSIYPKSEREAWITSSDNLLVLFDTELEKVIDYWQDKSRTGAFYGLRLIDSHSGALWSGLHRGVYIYHPMAQQMHRREIPVGREDRYNYNPTAITRTRDGTLWACFDSAPGLYRTPPGTEEVQLVVPPSGSEAARSGWHGVGMTKLKNGQLLAADYYNLFVVAEGDDKMQYFPFPASKKNLSISDIMEDSRGDIWVTTIRGGLFRRQAHNGMWKHYQQELTAPDHRKHFTWLWGLTEDELGHIWWRAANGYSVYFPERDSFLNFPYHDGQGNNFANIQDLEPDFQGRMWVAGPQEGLGIIDIRQPERGIIDHFSPGNVFFLPAIRYLKRDSQGNIWALGDRVLSRIRPPDLTMEYFDKYYGLPTYDTELNLAALDGASLDCLPDGTMALGYRRGWALFRPEALRHNSTLPQPYVQSFQVFEEEYPLDSSLLVKRAPVELPYWNNFFSFEFSAINFSAPEQTRFKYQLTGINDDWIDARDRRYAVYTNIPPGNYTFRLMAANNEGQWNKEVYELQLTIATPWWKRTWFLVSISAIFIGMLYAAYRYRIEQIRSQKAVEAAFERQLAGVKMNALRAQMNPHFIFNSLNSIENFINKNDTQKAAEYLNSFARLIRLILQNSRSDLVPMEDELEAVQLYLEMERLRFGRAFEYAVHIGDRVDVDDIMIPPMLIQPYIENAIWHGLMNKTDGVTGRVTVRLEQVDHHLYCTIEDNGVGREKAMEIKTRKAPDGRKSVGMKITGDRIQLINKLFKSNTSVEIHDLKDPSGKAAGTRVELRIPV